MLRCLNILNVSQLGGGLYVECGLVDPVTEVGELSVDARVALPAAAEAPGHEATQDVQAGRAGERAATVSLAGILPAQSTAQYITGKGGKGETVS